MKQWGLWKGTGIAFFEREHAPVYVSVALTAVVLFALHEVIGPSIWAAVPLAALGSLIVVLTSRRILQAGDTFPELARFRVIRLILGGER